MTKNIFSDDKMLLKKSFLNFSMVTKKVLQKIVTNSQNCNSYTYNIMYNRAICLADSFIELKGGLIDQE